MELPSEVQVALAAFVAVLAANALKWASRFITNYVRGTPNKLDDKIWTAMRDALHQVQDEDLEEREDAVSEREDVVSEREFVVDTQEDDAAKPARDDVKEPG